MSKERPILMSAPMVRAILNSSKTQTRRVIPYEVTGPNPPNDYFDFYQPLRTSVAGVAPKKWMGAYGRMRGEREFKCSLKCPYGVSGDRLWVRETYSLSALHVYPCPNAWYRADFGSDDPAVEVEHTCPDKYQQKGTMDYCRFADCWACVEYREGKFKWKPAIFMPRQLSRITLEITEVRVERLNSISEADAIAEGVKVCDRTSLGKPPCYVWPGHGMDQAGLCHTAASTAYAMGWDAINGKKHPWEENPFVWVVEFRRVDG